MKNYFGIAVMLSASMAAAQTTFNLQGAVYSISGKPIQGATCQFKNIGNRATTDAQGKFSFTGTSGVKKVEGYSVSMASQGRQLTLKLDRDERVSVDVFNLSGKLVRSIADAAMSAGTHSLEFAAPQGAHQLYLLRVKMGHEIAWHKLTIQDGMSFLSNSATTAPAYALAKTAATDSLFCTAPGYDGGHTKVNGRAISAYTGTQNLRMFSTDKAWKDRCNMPITFQFDQGGTASAGTTRYKQILPNWEAAEMQVLNEVCQATFKTPTEPKRFNTYTARIYSFDGVANTGGSVLSFSTDYIAKQPNNYAGWAEVLGVQIHEATHSYQPYYSTTGADGFGEAMPDAVRALTGYFVWPKGMKCSGSYKDAYQTGGKYWYYIEMKYPGFLTTVWQQTAGDISARVQSITGQSLSSLVTECQTQGMP